MANIFISYAREDAPVAQLIYHELTQAGLKPWLDRESLLPGQEWKIEIRRAIAECDYFLALLSSRSVSKRGFIQRELKQGLEVLEEFPESTVFLLPARLDNCIPSHERLKDLHWIDLFPSFDEGLTKLKAALLRGRVESTTSSIISELPKEAVDSLFERTRGTCCICRKPGVQVHHIDSDLDNHEIGNLAVVCNTCLPNVRSKSTPTITPSQLRLYMACLYADLGHPRWPLDDVKRSFRYGKHGIRTLRSDQAIKRFSELALELTEFLNDHKLDFPSLTGTQPQHVAELHHAIAMVERAGDIFVRHLVASPAEWPQSRQSEFVSDFIGRIRHFGQCLARVNLDILEVYSPGLGEKLLHVIGRDIDLFLYVAGYCGRIDPENPSYKDHVLGLFAEHFSGDGYWELELYATSDLDGEWALRGVPTKDELLEALNGCVMNITRCKLLLSELIRNHWKLTEVIQ